MKSKYCCITVVKLYYFYFLAQYSEDANEVEEETSEKTTEEDGDGEQCEEEEDVLGALDTTISRENLLAFEKWKSHDNEQLNFCEHEGELSRFPNLCSSGQSIN